MISLILDELLQANALSRCLRMVKPILPMRFWSWPVEKLSPENFCRQEVTAKEGREKYSAKLLWIWNGCADIALAAKGITISDFPWGGIVHPKKTQTRTEGGKSRRFDFLTKEWAWVLATALSDRKNYSSPNSIGITCALNSNWEVLGNWRSYGNDWCDRFWTFWNLIENVCLKVLTSPETNLNCQKPSNSPGVQVKYSTRVYLSKDNTVSKLDVA